MEGIEDAIRIDSIADQSWPPELRRFMFDALTEALSKWSTNQITLTTTFGAGILRRFTESRMFQEREAGSTIHRLHEHFVARSVAILLDKWFPKQGQERVSEKASKSPDAYSLSVIKQAARTMRMKMDSEAMEDDQIVKELWPALCLTDEGFFLIPYLAIYESGKARSDFTVEEREEYRVSLDGKED